MPIRPGRRALLTLTLATLAARAPGGPGPLRIVVGFAPGGAADAVTRAFARALELPLERRVLVDNRPGADGVIAAKSVATAPPDGTTLLLGSSTALVAVPALRTPPPYDPFDAFVPVVGLGRFSMTLLVSAALPVRTTAELLRLIERRPDEIVAASSNSTAELALAQFVGWRRVLHVPYQGDAPALQDLLAGRVQLMFATGAATAPYLADGRLRRLGSTAPGGGLALDVIPWLGLFGPAGTPAASRLALAGGVQAALHDAPLRAQLAAQGFEPEFRPPPQFEAYFRRQYARFTAAARRRGLRLER